MKAMKISYYTGCILSMLVGVWHFFVPSMFGWYTYIPNQYENLIVGIDWTNFFFSLLLTGVSGLLVILGRKVFAKNKEVTIFYALLVFTWFCRVLITFINPWPLEPIAWSAYGQQVAAFIIFLALAIPFVFLIFMRRDEEK